MSISLQCPYCACAVVLAQARAGEKLPCRQCGQIFRIPEGAFGTVADEIATGSTPVPRQMEKREMPALFPPSTPFLPQITRHIERTLGPSPMVFHELVSTDIHLDMHVIPPQPGAPSGGAAFPHGRNFYTIVTAGMSTRPMKVPARCACDAGEAQPSGFAELLLTLPADWPGLCPDGTFRPEIMAEESNWWPIRWLKLLARLAHEQGVFVGAGQTFANQEAVHAGRGFAGNTQLAGIMAAPSVLHPKSTSLLIHDDLSIDFLALWPLYPEELALAERAGSAALAARFEQAGITDLIDIGRPNVAE